MKIKVYSGLSVSEAETREILPHCDFAPPIQRGDLLKDLRDQYHVIAIIDGKFDQYLAISPNEVLDGLRAGMKIYGASSMGAFRAAELDRFGMIGVGEVYRFIKSQAVFRDDFLAQLFFESGEVLTTTYIDFHFASLHFLEENQVQEAVVANLQTIFRELFYADRTMETMESALAEHELSRHDPGPHVNALRAIFARNWRQKNIDGKALLATIIGDLEHIGTTNRQLDRDFKLPDYLDQFYEPIFFS